MTQVATFDVGDLATNILEHPGEQPGVLATAADVSPDGSIVVVRTYDAVLAFARPAGGPLEAAYDAPACQAPFVDEPQGEAIAFSAAGDAYVTVSEGASQPLHRFAVGQADAAPTESPTESPASTPDQATSGSPSAPTVTGPSGTLPDTGTGSPLLLAGLGLGVGAAVVRRHRALVMPRKRTGRSSSSSS